MDTRLHSVGVYVNLIPTVIDDCFSYFFRLLYFLLLMSYAFLSYLCRPHFVVSRFIIFALRCLYNQLQG